MSSGPSQRRQQCQQSVQVQLHPQMSASLSAGLNRIANHFGLLDVPPPGSYLPSARLASSSIDQPQCAGAHVVVAPDSLDTAIQPQRSGQGHSQGSARSRDAAAALPSADRRSGKSASGAPEDLTKSTPTARLIRPRAIPLVHSGDSRGKTPSPSQRNAVVPMGGMEASKLEGSATSDENMQPRLVPRKGAGPELRKEGGGKIDEYLMRLLRNSSMPTAESSQSPQTEVRGGEPTTLSAPVRPVSETAQQQWQGSRLGPLAPGAGVKSSSLSYQPFLSGSGPVTQPGGGRLPPTNVASPLGPRVREARAGFQSLASQPSTTAAETSQEPAQRSRSVQFGAHRNGASEKGTTGGIPSARGSGEAAARAVGGSSQQQAQGVSQRVREAVGTDVWQHIQATIAEQSQEFQRQLTELHRIVHKQQQLQAGRSQLQSSGPHPPLFVGQHPTSMSQHPTSMSQQQGAGGSAWWLNSMPWASLSSGGGAGSWQANSVNQGSGDANMSSQKSLAGTQQLSRTTRIALDAQRRRRGSKSRATKSGGAKSLDNGSAPGSEPQEGGLSTGPRQNGGRTPQEAPQPATWFSVMSPYLQDQSQALAAQQNPAPTSSSPAQFDPLSAWYHYHFGQRPGLNGNAREQPKSATYGSALAGLGSAIPERGWENNCKQYFNFSMPGTSDNNTGNTSARQQPSFAHNQAMSAPPGILGRQQVQRQTAHDRDPSAERVTAVGMAEQPEVQAGKEENPPSNLN